MEAKLKLFATISVFAFMLLSVSASAQISYYGSSSDVQTSGLTKVELVITFANPVKQLSFDVIGRVQNFNASSLSGPVDCTIVIKGISTISCDFNLTSELKTVVLGFETPDYVKPLGDRFLYNADHTIAQDIEKMVAVVRLPEGMALVPAEGLDQPPGRLTFAQNATIGSEEGRRIKVAWELDNLKAGTPLRFEIFYENLVIPFWAELRIRQFLAFGAAIGAVIGFFWFWRSRKGHKLVLSVLDDFERKVIDVIVSNQGEINQRKVVELTNLSKAKVSRIVKSLADRGLIEIKRLGRTNKLKLLKKKLEL